jgi:Fe-Mn family superoxide dismutase
MRGKIEMPTRREACKSIGIAAATTYAGVVWASTVQSSDPSRTPYALPALPYGYDALEPYIDAETMQLHHDKHHATYISNLNTAVAPYPAIAKLSVEELISHLDQVPEAIRVAVRNNGGGHANHSLFWQLMQKNSPGQPKGEIAGAIDRGFGSFSGFQDQFTKAALSVFGSGWAWLSMDNTQGLKIQTTPNQESPSMNGGIPLLGIDVWEHAYYLKYQNRRAEYVNAFYKVIAWEFVNEQFRRAGKGQ